MQAINQIIKMLYLQSQLRIFRRYSMLFNRKKENFEQKRYKNTAFSRFSVNIRKNKKIGKEKTELRQAQMKMSVFSVIQKIKYAQILLSFVSKDLPLKQEFFTTTSRSIKKRPKQVYLFHLKMLNQHRSISRIIKFLLSDTQKKDLFDLQKEEQEPTRAQMSINMNDQEIIKLDSLIWTQDFFQDQSDCIIHDIASMDDEDFMDYEDYIETQENLFQSENSSQQHNYQHLRYL